MLVLVLVGELCVVDFCCDLTPVSSELRTYLAEGQEDCFPLKDASLGYFSCGMHSCSCFLLGVSWSASSGGAA